MSLKLDVIKSCHAFLEFDNLKNLLIVSVTFNKTEILVRVRMTAENI